MRTLTLGSMALTSLLIIGGCTTYVPVQPVPIARLTPEQVAAINSNDKLNDEQKQRLTAQNQQILRDQETAQTVIVGPAYSAYAYPGYYYPYPYAYPAYNPFYPFYPGISLSLGYVWGRNVGHGGGGRWHGHR